MIKKPTVKSSNSIVGGGPISPAMINSSPIIATQNHIPFKPIQMATPKTKARKVEKKLEFEDVLTFLKSKSEDYWSWQDDQINLIEKLCSIGDTRTILKFLLEKLKVSRFKSYKMAMKSFIGITEQYLSGEVEYEALIVYLDANVPNHADEHWYEEFNDIRRNLIGALSLNPKHREAEYQLTDVVKAFVSSEVDTKDENGLFEYDEKRACEAYINYIIDLSELVWPDKAKSLKILFGNNK